MRVTVCELPYERLEIKSMWNALCAHTRSRRSELVVLPEFAFVEPVWNREVFDHQVWDAQVKLFDHWLERLPELGAEHVIGARPSTQDGACFNEGFLWTPAAGYRPLRRKRYLPDEPGGWEARWFQRANDSFRVFQAGTLTFGLNICTELWALDSYAAYAAVPASAVVAPRATAAATIEKWLAVGRVAAVRAGAYCISSNRVHPDGSCGGVGWIIDPDGQTLALTSSESPFATVALDLSAAVAARSSYPRYVFR